MNTRKRKLAFLYGAVAGLGFVTGLLFVTEAQAHHGTKGETVMQAKFRDRAVVESCDSFRYDGKSPSLEICKALLSAVHRTHYNGRKANRSWVANRSLLKLLRKESGYHHTARNPSSGACGMGQMLPCAKYGHGSCWPALRKQAVCYVRYILGRYGTPERAWTFWLRNNWY